MIILLDVDGVLADFCQGMLGLIEEETGWRYTPNLIDEWSITSCGFFKELAHDVGRDHRELEAAVWKRSKRVGFCSSLPVLPGAKEAVDALRGMGEVHVLTAPLGGSTTWMHEREEWLHRHFGFKHADVTFTSKKHRFFGDVLVDDKPEHVEEWKLASCLHQRAILWDAPYNRRHELKAGGRAASWEEVIQQASWTASIGQAEKAENAWL